jgi:transcriptional regulator with XRE-family HTH domain
MRILSKNATVAEKIRFYRTKRDMHGYMLAELVGLSRHAIMDYENNQTEPLLKDLKKIATTLGIEADMLYDDYYRFLDYPYSEKIREIRKEHGLHQRQLAKILGADRRTIERWEHGRSVIKRATWGKLKILGFL